MGSRGLLPHRHLDSLALFVGDVYLPHALDRD
jgi:hypothetical protein